MANGRFFAWEPGDEENYWQGAGSFGFHDFDGLSVDEGFLADEDDRLIRLQAGVDFGFGAVVEAGLDFGLLRFAVDDLENRRAGFFGENCVIGE